jgi:hypothetical protein
MEQNDALKFNEWKKERNRVMREVDINAPEFQRLNPITAKAAIHKARYECTEIEPELRHESRKWLQENGLKRLFGLDFESDERLPE